MVLTGMLFLIGLSNDISERKMILYLSIFPLTLFTISSLFILSNIPIKSISLTKTSLVGFVSIR